MWIPYIIFQNTDDDEAIKVDALTEDGNIRTKVSVKRQSNFVRSELEMADEVWQKRCLLYLLKVMLPRLRYSEGKKT